MLRQFIGAAAMVFLLADVARAQITGDSPRTGIGAAVANSPGSIRGVMRSHGPDGYGPDYINERNYRETVKRIPDKKPSNDPWKNLRQAPTASSVDRHRPL